MNKEDRLKAIYQGYLLHTVMCLVTMATLLAEYDPRINVQIVLLLLAWLMLWEAEGRIEQEDSKSKSRSK